MIAYEFYIHDRAKGDELVAILPERRKDPSRITQESISHWAETVLGKSLSNKIYYIEVTTNEYTGWLFRPSPPLLSQK